MLFFYMKGATMKIRAILEIDIDDAANYGNTSPFSFLKKKVLSYELETNADPVVDKEPTAEKPYVFSSSNHLDQIPINADHPEQGKKSGFVVKVLELKK